MREEVIIKTKQCELHKSWGNIEILITGGTGSLGNAVTELLCKKYKPKGIRILSRDELKQKQMKVKFSKYNTPIAYLLGDIRDMQRLKLATKNVDMVIHAAALKDISKCEDDPFEAGETNIQGSKNVILACIENDVKKCMLISTDKSVYPVNLYGATKMVAERYFIHSNIYSPHRTKFSACRYGNVAASRGSVIELFEKQKETGVLKITDKDMTRFWISLKKVAEFVIDCVSETKGKEIFVPRMKSFKIWDLARIIGEKCKYEEIGMREGEKLHECLITSEESIHAKILKDKYIIDFNYYNPVPFSYTSKDCLISEKELKEKLKEIK
jgi:FlaA1/EpsC-like NDP-sugar epimerase